MRAERTSVPLSMESGIARIELVGNAVHTECLFLVWSELDKIQRVVMSEIPFGMNLLMSWVI